MKNVIVTSHFIKKLLPTRKRTDNKTAGGKCLIIAGSKGLYGAGILASRAAYRVGAGYVYLCTDPRKFPLYERPEFLIVDRKKKLNLSNYSSVAIGPGLGKNSSSKKLLTSLLKGPFKKVIADADALNLLAQMKIHPLPADWILTPHEGELARLLNTNSKKIKDEREKSVQNAYKKFKCIILLKGSPTLICNESRVYKIKTGNVSLAKAGTGDVLTGMIAGFLSQGLKPLDAALLSAFLHGDLADEWLKTNDYLSLSASDLIESIPKIIKKLRA